MKRATESNDSTFGTGIVADRRLSFFAAEPWSIIAETLAPAQTYVNPDPGCGSKISLFAKITAVFHGFFKAVAVISKVSSETTPAGKLSVMKSGRHFGNSWEDDGHPAKTRGLHNIFAGVFSAEMSAMEPLALPRAAPARPAFEKFLLPARLALLKRAPRCMAS